MINRKSHTIFRLVPKSTILDDPEGSQRTVFQNVCVSENDDACADIRSGSQDLYKFSLDFMPAPVYYVHTYLTLYSLSSSFVLQQFTAVIYQRDEA